MVVSGSVEPDTYVVSKENDEILSRRIGYKQFKIVRGADGNDLNIDLDEAEALKTGPQRRRGSQDRRYRDP